MTMPDMTARNLLKSSILICSGDLRVSTDWSWDPTLPISVEFPTAMTRARPLPEQIKVPVKATFLCSLRGGDCCCCCMIDGEDRGEDILVTAVVSPVREDSSIFSSIVSIRRQSAGTRLWLDIV